MEGYYDKYLKYKSKYLLLQERMINEGKYDKYRKKYQLELPFTENTHNPYANHYENKQRDFDLITMTALTSGNDKIKEEYKNNILPYAPNDNDIVPNVARVILRQEKEDLQEEISKLNQDESPTTPVDTVSSEESINIFAPVSDTSDDDYGNSDVYSI